MLRVKSKFNYPTRLYSKVNERKTSVFGVAETNTPGQVLIEENSYKMNTIHGDSALAYGEVIHKPFERTGLSPNRPQTAEIRGPLKSSIMLNKRHQENPTEEMQSEKPEI
jgi:hypothetical protein